MHLPLFTCAKLSSLCDAFFHAHVETEVVTYTNIEEITVQSFILVQLASCVVDTISLICYFNCS